MPTITFHCNSKRTQDINLQEGKNINDLKAILAANGLDVSEARIYISDDKGINIGHLELRSFKEDDEVLFKTRVISNNAKIICSLNRRKQAERAAMEEQYRRQTGTCRRGPDWVDIDVVLSILKSLLG